MAFELTGVNRLSASVFSENVNSMRVLGKAGFKQEVVLKQSLFKHGKLYDEHLFSLLRHP